HRSKMLSAWLRHKPERAGLTLSSEGWVTIDEVLAAYEKADAPTSRDEFDNVVRLDPKGRFEVERDRVRARYGHSIQLEATPHPGMPPAMLFHGTPRRYLPRILESGLSPMKRQYVRSEEHTSKLQSPDHLVCRLLLEKKKQIALYVTRLQAEGIVKHEDVERFKREAEAIVDAEPRADMNQHWTQSTPYADILFA